MRATRLVITVLALAASACATARVRPTDPVALGSSRAHVLKSHGHAQADGQALRLGHEVSHLVYANPIDFLVVCLVDDHVVSWKREFLPPHAPCAEYPIAPTFAAR